MRQRWEQNPLPASALWIQGAQPPLYALGVPVWAPLPLPAVLSIPPGLRGDILLSPPRLTPRCSTRAGSPSSSSIRRSW